MKSSVLTIIIIIVGIIAVLGMIGFIFLKSSGSSTTPLSQTNQSTQTSQTAQTSSQVPVKDFAPNMPMNQKTTIVIQTSDSSDIKYVVPKDQVATYVKSLPPGYHVVSQSP